MLGLKLGIINGSKNVFQKIADGFIELMQKIADNPIAKKLFDFNVDDIKASISMKLDDKFNTKEIVDAILEVQNSIREEVDGTERITEALKTNGASTFGKVFEIANNIKKYMPDLKELWDIQGNTKTSSDYLKQMNEQEEELRWLKAFSDRQIIDRYNQSTSNTRNVNIYGASPNAVNHAAMLNASRFPPKAATL
jgi:cysteinyl-tRNA synthetase